MIKLNRTEDQEALIRAMASKNAAEASEARQAFAEVIVGPLVQQVLAQAPVMSNLFEDLEFSEGDDNSIPMDLFFDVKDEEYVKVWSQSQPGGLATSTVNGSDEIKFSVYELDSAVSANKKYMAVARFDVVNKMLTRMAQEILLKQEVTSANVIMAALANASTNGNSHIISAQTAGLLKLHDFNRLMTLKSRIWTSFVNGTAMDPGARGITDLLLSPEAMQSIREWTYNPVNTRQADGSAAGSERGIEATPSMRDEIYRSAGLPNVYGINLIQVNELGVGYKYNTIFDAYDAGRTYDGTTFNGSSKEIVVGIDAGMSSLVRPVQVEGNAQFIAEEDDQFVRRQRKVGFYGWVNEGRLVLDDRALCGIIL